MSEIAWFFPIPLSPTALPLILSSPQLTPDDPLIVGSTLPTDLCLTDLITGKSVSMESYWKQSVYTLFILERHYA